MTCSRSEGKDPQGQKIKSKFSRQPHKSSCHDQLGDHFKYWLKDLRLTVIDQQQLLGGDWLTDKHINVAHQLLSQQFPTLNGLQDPLFLAMFDHPYKSSGKDFIQIVNITNQHWVCVSNVISSPGVVEVYDSMPFYSTGSSALSQQVAKMLKTGEKSFQLKHVDVQRQRDGNDCALFALANATTLCFGGDPHVTSYVQDDLRAHLSQCFETGCMSTFPTPDRPRRLGRQRVINSKTVDVFCTCRLPWNRYDHELGPLAQCQLCKEWYHQVCMEIDEEVFHRPALKYNCKICLQI